MENLSLVEETLGGILEAAKRKTEAIFSTSIIDTINQNILSVRKSRRLRDLLTSAMAGSGGGVISPYNNMENRDSNEGDFCGGENCSGNGECVNGTCYCQIQYEGSDCKRLNFSYHVAFSSIFFLLALTSLIQLVMCIHAEYLRMKKNRSIVRACRVTTQKLLYFLTFMASALRGAYFAAPSLGTEWSISLLSAYYPVVLSGSSLIVCFWAEVFHLREIRWEKPRFLSKSFLGFVVFNIISYALFFCELFLVWIEHEDRQFYKHIFTGCYAGLMFIVVIFFLIYGVEVFFKVNGEFAVPQVPGQIASSNVHYETVALNPIIKNQQQLNNLSKESQSEEDPMIQDPNRVDKESKHDNKNHTGGPSVINLTRRRSSLIRREREARINASQLHQSRLGLLSQALMLIITVVFLFSETLEQFWKYKVDLMSRNTHDLIFRIVEIGVALWFPCVLWNCIRPEQLWCLNPKKIIERFPPLKGGSKSVRGGGEAKANVSSTVNGVASCDENEEDFDDLDERQNGGDADTRECWICYDGERDDAGAFIYPCDCKGDVGAVHHDCLKRWLIESADNPDSLKCKVCRATYMVEKGSQFSLTQGFTVTQWLATTGITVVMLGSVASAWTVIHFYTATWIRMIAVGLAMLILYLCLRSLGLNTVNAYQRAKVSALKIVNIKRRRNEKKNNREQQQNSQDIRADNGTQDETQHITTLNLQSLRNMERQSAAIRL